MRFTTFALGTSLLALGLAGPDRASAQAQTAAPPAPIPAAPATLSNDLRPRFVAQEPDDLVTSKLVGLSIQNGANETIGQVADVVFDGSRTIKAFVVSVGGFLGIGAKYVAVDPSALHLTRVDDKTLKAVIETDRDQLRAAPEYRYLAEQKSTTADASKAPADASKAPADASKPAADVSKPADGAPKP